MKFCPECERANLHSVSFCGHCGAALPAEEIERAPPPVRRAAAAPPQTSVPLLPESEIQEDLDKVLNRNPPPGIAQPQKPRIQQNPFFPFLFLLTSPCLLLSGAWFNTPETEETGIFLFILGCFTTVIFIGMFLNLVEKAWSLEACQKPPFNPRAPLLVVPLFNFYWLFRTINQWAVVYNRQREEGKIPQNLFFLFCAFQPAIPFYAGINIFIHQPEVTLAKVMDFIPHSSLPVMPALIMVNTLLTCAVCYVMIRAIRAGR